MIKAAIKKIILILMMIRENKKMKLTIEKYKKKSNRNSEVFTATQHKRSNK